jgi:hypothetical protein
MESLEFKSIKEQSSMKWQQDELLSPLKPGMKGNFPALTFQHLSNAFESFIKIKQLNGQGGDILKKCIEPALDCDLGWL